MALDIEKCKECKYFSSYYHGGAVGAIQISRRCWWTLKPIEKISEKECNRNDKRRSNGHAKISE